MLRNIALGSGMVVFTTIIHSLCMWGVLVAMRISHAERWGMHTGSGRMTLVAAVVLVMFLAGLIEAAAWAQAYLFVGALTDAESALYFSTVTFTTLGFGDVVLDEGWRLLASLQAANGIIMFGWTTALIVSTVQRVYFSRSAIEMPEGSN